MKSLSHVLDILDRTTFHLTMHNDCTIFLLYFATFYQEYVKFPRYNHNFTIMCNANDEYISGHPSCIAITFD